MVTVTLASADTLTWGGRVDIPGLSVDGHSYSGIQGYSDIGGEGWTSLVYPWMVTVTLASADTLTWGGGSVDIPGLSMDGHGYSGIHGYSDMRGWCVGYSPGWISLDYPWMVILTMGIH